MNPIQKFLIVVLILLSIFEVNFGAFSLIYSKKISIQNNLHQDVVIGISLLIIFNGIRKAFLVRKFLKG